MALTSNLYLALTGVTGAGAAVGIPLTYIYREDLGLTSSNYQVPKANKAAAFENIQKCENNTSGEVINFGEQGVNKVCGTTEESTESANLQLAEDSKYTHLFKQMGNNQHGSGSSGNDYGKTSCNKNTGIFGKQIVGGESLGLCDDTVTTMAQNQGLTVQNENNTSIKVCSGDCFNSQTQSNWKTLDASQEKNKWTKIVFKKQTENSLN